MSAHRMRAMDLSVIFALAVVALITEAVLA